jgi:hypothetical protein
MQDAFIMTSRKVLASKFSTRTHRTYKYGHIHGAQKKKQNNNPIDHENGVRQYECKQKASR